MAIGKCIWARDALAPFTDRITYLEEGDWVALTREGADIHEPSGQRAKRRIQPRPAGSLLAEKGNYRHFMAKEIHEQPEVVGHTLARYIDMAALKLKPFAWPADPKQLKRLTIIGCGERWARLPVEIDVASTKAFTCRLAALAIGLGRRAGRSMKLPRRRWSASFWAPSRRSVPIHSIDLMRLQLNTCVNCQSIASALYSREYPRT
jgi:glucosamine 6-phosphate synthetase-like amidotransferase/phosphosugar isomerase protein